MTPRQRSIQCTVALSLETHRKNEEEEEKQHHKYHWKDKRRQSLSTLFRNKWAEITGRGPSVLLESTQIFKEGATNWKFFIFPDFGPRLPNSHTLSANNGTDLGRVILSHSNCQNFQTRHKSMTGENPIAIPVPIQLWLTLCDFI